MKRRSVREQAAVGCRRGDRTLGRGAVSGSGSREDVVAVAWPARS
jgi:hypothetical protein